jgi:hypothetical protein
MADADKAAKLAAAKKRVSVLNSYRARNIR